MPQLLSLMEVRLRTRYLTKHLRLGFMSLNGTANHCRKKYIDLLFLQMIGIPTAMLSCVNSTNR